MKRELVKILQKVPLLSQTSENKLLRLIESMKIRTFHDGDCIIRQGDVGDCFYIITKGEVKCTQSTLPGSLDEEKARFRSRSFFGEQALTANIGHKANMIACGPVKCLVLTRLSFEAVRNSESDGPTM